MITLDLTAFSYAMAVVVTYYLVLYLLGAAGVSVPPIATEKRPLVVIVIPAHNEEIVLDHTLQAALGVAYSGSLRILVVDDASTDHTGEIAGRVAAAEDRVRVLRRGVDIGGRGKSEVLNHAYTQLSSWHAARDPWLERRLVSSIVLCILDADGRLSPRALQDATAFFCSRRVGAVQVGVKIRNARESMLARMQDIEFVGFSFMVQTARDRLGSVGLGGNGQFTRMSALAVLGARPWAPDALTEDLDLGLRLRMAGWRLRFCSTAWVDQQGLTRLRPLLRQRTRWAQGHYQCWRHIPAVLRCRRLRFVSRLDILAYLVLIAMVLVVTAVIGVRVLDSFGILTATNTFLGGLGSGVVFRTVILTLSWLPLWLTIATYQRYAVDSLRWWEWPTYCVLFAAYVYLWAIATVRAWARAAMRRGNWVKTPRTTNGECYESARGTPVWESAAPTAIIPRVDAEVLTDA